MKYFLWFKDCYVFVYKSYTQDYKKICNIFGNTNQKIRNKYFLKI